MLAMGGAGENSREMLTQEGTRPCKVLERLTTCHDLQMPLLAENEVWTDSIMSICQTLQ